MLYTLTDILCFIYLIEIIISLSSHLHCLSLGENSSGNKVCLRSTIVSTIVGLGCSLICMMVGIFLILCSRIRRATRDKLLSDSLTYMTHKGRIN